MYAQHTGTSQRCLGGTGPERASEGKYCTRGRMGYHRKGPGRHHISAQEHPTCKGARCAYTLPSCSRSSCILGRVEYLTATSSLPEPPVALGMLHAQAQQT
jgi:hypothetical protein